MRHQKRFWQGALCGALAVLLGLGLVSCAGRLPFLSKEEAVSQETKEKLSGIQALGKWMRTPFRPGSARDM